ncbi:hypothetical protein AAC03nite_15170 [Alicyclobacillus acidoterrestris]|uniref:DUF2953 domain-containing protein n=1 Tax=Alicyclobacillus suci TaxID=2816080 RepID=UPI001190624D|nr:DUF2953 domain-containing protein [Alicyclobacillus suci]GEO25732.1 hypothetical protein AAC03nite_15170 [Alicyclobacillus acidoterrestris]
MIWLCIVLAVLICLAMLLLLPVEIRIHYEHLQEDDRGTLEIRYLFGLVHLKRELTKMKVGITDEGPTVGANTESDKHASKRMLSAAELPDVFRDLRSIWNFRRTAGRILGRFGRHLHVQVITLEANVGFTDAVLTGTSIGFLYMVVEMVFGCVSQYCRLHQVPTVAIHPVFNQSVLQVRTQSIMKVRLGYAISAGIRLLVAWKRRT